MTNSTLQPDTLRKIASSQISNEIKVEILQDLARLCLPPGAMLESRIRNLQPTRVVDEETLNNLIEGAAFWLESVGPYIASPDEVLAASQSKHLIDPKDIETEIRLYVNEKFTTSPYFLGMTGLLAICLTLFTVGLMNLNKDVRSADETVAKMQQEIGSATSAMSAAQDKQLAELAQRGREFEDRMGASEGRIRDSEKNVTLTIDTRFKQELDEVRLRKADTITAITDEGKDAADKVNASLAKAQATNVAKINDRGNELYYQLQKPTWKQLAIVGFKSNWPLWVVSAIVLILGLIANFRIKA